MGTPGSSGRRGPWAPARPPARKPALVGVEGDGVHGRRVLVPGVEEDVLVDLCGRPELPSRRNPVRDEGHRRDAVEPTSRAWNLVLLFVELLLLLLLDDIFVVLLPQQPKGNPNLEINILSLKFIFNKNQFSSLSSYVIIEIDFSDWD